eukprot:Cvel_24827.t1-p1 / transcript=Cvel_24827.t1 / gene=Cvel_24827 / organism=Chromera_velia_CCMP2878 / gene_product=Ubiquitin carboxyl-terminal hydrolase 42, putative / transcript_product=Ubiquitin carboxyl-terminal hydrolase 42, putative / location=Cvel_scaffold2738:1-2178(-) / protein_length=435 / sequence_SO=supercontig / SO=protein_coding / is_pseudo=false
MSTSRAVVIERELQFVDVSSLKSTAATQEASKDLPKLLASSHFFQDADLPSQTWDLPVNSTFAPAGAGLRNTTVVCYLNSTIQALTHNPAFCNFLLSEKHPQNCRRRGEDCFICTFQKHARQAFEARGKAKVLGNNQIFGPLRREWRIDRFEMQDAHEAFMKLVEMLNFACIPGSQVETFNKLPEPKQATTLINKLFGGFIRSTVRCLACHKASHRFELCTDLQVELQGVNSVRDALRKFTEREMLTGANQYECESCKGKRDAYRQSTVHRPPRNLLLCLKRFSWTAFGTKRKIRKPISFTMEINLAPFSSRAAEISSPVAEKTEDGEGQERGKGRRARRERQQNSLSSASADSPPSGVTLKTLQKEGEHELIKKCAYELWAAVMHHGKGMSTGHYTACCKGVDGKWRIFDDEDVRPLRVRWSGKSGGGGVRGRT